MEKEIQRALITKFRKHIYAKVINACEKYNLIKPHDKIAVCISGGKDSFLLAKCMQEILKHGKMKFDLEFIVMNPGYKKEHLDNIISNAKLLSIPIKIFNGKCKDRGNV